MSDEIKREDDFLDPELLSSGKKGARRMKEDSAVQQTDSVAPGSGIPKENRETFLEL